MALCNHSTQEINFKIVYSGPTQSGKTTNLKYIHKKLDPHFRGDLISLPGEFNRFQTYKNLPIKAGTIEGYQSAFDLYTHPGSSLEGVDAVVFVVDSTPERMIENLEALQLTRQNLEKCGVDPDAIPFLFQFNKRDLPNALAPEEIDDFLGGSAASVLTCARSGYQVFATLDIITEIVLNNFHVSSVMRREQNEENIDNSSNIALSS